MKDRNYGIDLLRMVAMCMVATLHILGHGGILRTAEPLSLHYGLAWFIEISCYCAVNCYALISGYVGVNSTFKFTNLVMLWLQVAFYSFGIAVFFQIISPEAVTLKQIIRSMFPIASKQYWYFNAYVCLLLFTPIINEALRTFSATLFKRLVICMAFFLSILPAIAQNDIFITKDGYSTLWLMFAYILGAYFSKYGFSQKCSSAKSFIIYFVSVLSTWAVKMVDEYVTLSHSVEVSWAERLINYTSPTILLSSIALLYLFSKIRLKDSIKKVVILFSPSAFSVYLIHENALSRSIFINNQFIDYCSFSIVKFFFMIILTALTIYVICSCIDYIRIRLFNALQIRNRIEQIYSSIFPN